MNTLSFNRTESRMNSTGPAFPSGCGLGRPPTNERSEPESILLVEDDQMIRCLAQRILTQAGFEVLEADSAGQAIEVWGNHADRIDLMLTDVCIPYRATGLELARRFSAEKPDLKVVYTSGFSPEMAADDGVLRHNINFLAKPYNPAALVQIVRDFLRPIAG